MAHSKAEAVRRLRDAKAAQVAALRALADYDRATAAIAKQRARWSVPALWQRANGKVERIDLGAFAVARAYGDSADETRTDEQRHVGLLAGNLKVRTGLSGADEQRVRAITTRMRVMAAPDAKRLAYLDRTIRKLVAERDALIGIEAWRRGTVMGEGLVAQTAIDHSTVIRKHAPPKGGEWGRYNLEAKVTSAARELEQATIHLQAAEAGGLPECGCGRCSSERQHAVWEKERKERERQEAARLRALPKVRIHCQVRGEEPHDTTATWDATERVVRCPTHGTIRSSGGLKPLVEAGWITKRAAGALLAKEPKEDAAA